MGMAQAARVGTALLFVLVPVECAPDYTYDGKT
jgi:hypothetical protein